MSERLRAAIGTVGFIVTAAQALTGFQSIPLGLSLLTAAPLVALWGLWPTVSRLAAHVPGSSVLLRSPLVRVPRKVELLTPVAQPPVVAGPSMRELVKEWYHTDGHEALRLARNLMDKLAERAAAQGKLGQLVCDLVREQVINTAWNSLGPIEKALNGEATMDTGVVLDWLRNYQLLLRWASRLSTHLGISGEPELAKWQVAHAQVVRSLTALLARDMFDSVRQQAIWARVRAEYRFQ